MLLDFGKPSLSKENLISFLNKFNPVFKYPFLSLYDKPVKIIEAQLGGVLKETDIVRYQDVYGRVK